MVWLEIDASELEHLVVAKDLRLGDASLISKGTRLSDLFPDGLLVENVSIVAMSKADNRNLVVTVEGSRLSKNDSVVLGKSRVE